MDSAIQILKKIILVYCCLVISQTMTHAQDISLAWAKGMGGPVATSGGASKEGLSVSTDADGNVYTTGLFWGTTDFDPGPGSYDLTPLGACDIFVSKLDKNGVFVWAKQIGGYAMDRGNAITVDKNGVYIAGYYRIDAGMPPGQDSIDLDPGQGVFKVGEKGNRILLLKLDHDGNFVWAKNMGNTMDDYDNLAYAVTTDHEGNVLITGTFGGTVDFDPGAGTALLTADPSGSYGSGIFTCKFSSSGSLIWAKSMGSVEGNNLGFGIAVDTIGNVYTTGNFQGTVDFDPGTGVSNLTSRAYQDCFVSKLDAAGNFVWAKHWGSVFVNVGYDIIVDNEQNVYTTGTFQGTVDFDPGPDSFKLVSNGFADVFINKLDSNGKFLWVKTMGGSASDYAYSIALDRKGNVYTIGHFQGSVDFDPGADTFILETRPGVHNIYFNKLGKDGDFLWAKCLYGYAASNMGYGLTVDSAGNIYCTGTFQEFTDFDPGTDTFNLVALSDRSLNGSARDLFVAKYQTVCYDSYSELAWTACRQFQVADTVFTESGSYTLLFPNVLGCDSTVVFHLSVVNLEPVINVNGFELSTTQSYSDYQWMLDEALIPGADDAVYTVTENGDYRVIVTDSNGCSDTSAIYTVTNVGIQAYAQIGSLIKVYPIPSTDIVHINSPVKVNALLTSVEGKSIFQINNTESVSLKGLSPGIYWLHITDAAGHLLKVQKVIKQ